MACCCFVLFCFVLRERWEGGREESVLSLRIWCLLRIQSPPKKMLRHTYFYTQFQKGIDLYSASFQFYFPVQGRPNCLWALFCFWKNKVLLRPSLAPDWSSLVPQPPNHSLFIPTLTYPASGHGPLPQSHLPLQPDLLECIPLLFFLTSSLQNPPVLMVLADSSWLAQLCRKPPGSLRFSSHSHPHPHLYNHSCGEPQ